MKSIKYLSLLFAALIATAVNAQERAIEEVIVTATKRAESVQDIPLSVNAFTGAQLEEAGVKDIRDIAAQTPGLSIKSRGETEGSVFIRGIGSAAPRNRRGSGGWYLHRWPVRSARYQRDGCIF